MISMLTLTLKLNVTPTFLFPTSLVSQSCAEKITNLFPINGSAGPICLWVNLQHFRIVLEISGMRN